MTRWLLLLLILFSLPGIAEIYEKVQPDGSVTFSDMPSNDSREVDIMNTNTYVAPVSQPEKQASTSPLDAIQNKLNGVQALSSGTTKRAEYSGFSIISPTDNQTFQNQRLIKVTVNVQPQLNKGDKIQITVDGKAHTTLASRVLVLNNLDRGTHEIQANILNPNGQIIKTASAVTIHVKYTSKLLSPLKDSSPAFNPGLTTTP